MEDNGKPIYKYSNPAITIEVYPNRIEISNRSILFGRKELIPMRNVANVESSYLAGQVTIKTTDGKRYKYRVGFSADKVRDAIKGAL